MSSSAALTFHRALTSAPPFCKPARLLAQAIPAQAVVAFGRHRQPRGFLAHQQLPAGLQENSVPQPEQARRREVRLFETI